MIFVSGLPRSCSTLLMNLLAQNDELYCTPTSCTVSLLDGMQNQFSTAQAVKAQPREKLEKMFISAAVGMMNGFYETKKDKIIIDKNRAWLSKYYLLKKMYKDVKIIVCIRDLVPVMESLEKRTRTNPEYVEQSNRGSIVSRTKQRLESPMIKDCIENVYDALTFDQNDVLFIRAEDLCFDPMHELSRIYKFIGKTDVIPNIEKIHSKTVIQKTHERDEVNMPYGSHDIHTVIQPLKNKNIFNVELAQYIEELYPWYFSTFYPR